MKSNFDFLRKYWKELAELGETAESYLYSDSNACILKIGLLAETIVRSILAYESIDLPEDTRQSNLIRILKNNDIIPDKIDHILYAIRKERNDAAHNGGGTVDKAKLLLEMAYNLCVWYMEVYGDWKFSPASFVIPEDISKLDTYSSIIENHENRLKELFEKIELIKTEAASMSSEERKEKADDAAESLNISSGVVEYIKKDSLRIEMDMIPFLNYVLQKNKVNIVQSLVIENDRNEDITDVILKVSSSPEICHPFEKHIEIIPSNSSLEVKDINLVANVNYLCNLTENEESNISFTIIKNEQVICSNSQIINALPFDEWHGSVYHPELLSAFVTPNAPIISALVKRASEHLKNWTGDPSLDGYQSNDPERVMKQVGAVYASLQEQNITYAVPPASFERVGQRVRLCDMVISQKLGTCLDLTLLFASCVEAIGLHPILVLLEGHIFAGVWLGDETFPDAVIDDASQVTKRLASGIDELIVVECTAFCSSKNQSFDEACDYADTELRGGDVVQCVIDISRSRKTGITPIPSRIKSDNGYTIIEDEAEYVTSAPKREINILDIDSSVVDGARTKKDMWERKLLDLGLRNKLINMSLKPVIPILTDSIDTIEDILADGKDLYIYPRPKEWHILAKELDFDNMHDLGANTELIHHELESKRLRSALGEGEVLAKLKQLYRTAKLSLEENGANTLYIALGLLKWYETERSQKPRYAPLLLVPIEIIRKGGNQGYVIRMRDEEPQLNITILEKLSQDFEIKIPGLETLPTDEHGIDTRRVFTIIRHGIMNQSRWDVLESAYIGIFSFSQFVMWNDIRNRADDLARNKIVRSLMEGKLVWNPEPMNFDEYNPSTDLYLPISVDGSQMYAVDSAGKGKSFILHGPPGTGKSQTITVMIANALAQGKSVLFVAEKMAALEVVQKRLNDIGIGPFCLELHSNKAKKKDVLEQLRQASEVGKGTNKEEYERKLASINEIKESLDKYAIELHKTRKSGLSFFDIINKYENYSECKDIKLDGMLESNQIDNVMFEKMERTVERLIATGRAIGHPHNHPLSMIGLREYSQSIKERIDEAVRLYLDGLKGLQFSINRFISENNLDEPVSYADIYSLVNRCCNLEKWFNCPHEWALDDNANRFIEIEEMAMHFLQKNNIRNELLLSWKEDFLQLPVDSYLDDYNRVVAKWALPRAIGIGKIAKSLALYSNNTVDKKRLGDNLLLLKQYQYEQSEAYRLLELYKDSISGLFSGEATEWNVILEKAQFAKNNIAELVKICPDKNYIREILAKENNYSMMSEIEAEFEKMLQSRKNITELLLLKEFNEKESWFENEYAMCGNIVNHKDDIKEWITWLTVTDEAAAIGLSNIVDAYYEGLAHEEVIGAYYKAIYQHLAKSIIGESDVLNGFSGALFDDQVARFKKIDTELTELSKKAIYYTLASRIPDFAYEASKSSEVGILQRAIKSNGRGYSIRALMDQLSTLLPKLCPCMLMSPISAAQYLDPNRAPFDLVIFDEASQLPTCKAVGALARGEEAIIVGDPKQMPPTSFFASNTFDEDNAESEDLESILEDCLALNMPESHLLWHYRSRHESLISFSNEQFYDNKLYTFPSVNDRESKVTLEKVDGIFERGKNRCNRKEAECIVEEIKRRAKDEELSKYSVGIVTFNISQQNLIDDMLSDACNEDPELEAWIYNDAEPLFVKNLENVQGDERDVILFSIAYGPDENGKISMNFGPLNRDKGWRRLNVAVSRARYEMKVYSSLSADQINLSRTQAEGVAALKAFLEYASGKTALLNEYSVVKQNQRGGGIAKKIQGFLKDNGYDSDILIGHSEFKIDVGVIDPEDKDNYLLGIVLDGESYHTSKTTRDREVAQISVLKGLGWHVHRVWTMDWYDNSGKELSKILGLLEELKNHRESTAMGGALSEKRKPVVNNIVDSEPKKIASVAVKKRSLLAKKYQITELDVNYTYAEDIFDLWKNEIPSKMILVVNTEYPICENMLYKRICQSYGVSRVGSKLQKNLASLVPRCGFKMSKQNNGIVFWPGTCDPLKYYGVRSTGEEENKRDAKDVPIIEALNAICYILSIDISVEEKDLIREAAKVMGYARLGTAVAALFEEALVLGRNIERIVLEDSKWRLTDSGNAIIPYIAEYITNEERQKSVVRFAETKEPRLTPVYSKSINTTNTIKKCVFDKVSICDSSCNYFDKCSHAND